MRPLHVFPMVLILALVGCYAYVPVAAPPEPGQPVRADFTDEGITAVQAALGAGVGGVDGMMLRANGDTFTMSVALMRTVRGDFPGSGQPITLRWDQVDEVKEKRFDLRRSILFGGVVAVAGYLIGNSFRDNPGRVTQRDSMPVDPDPKLRPLPGFFSLRIPIGH